MAFQDFDELFDPLVLPIHGKKYTIPPVTAMDGIKLNRFVNPQDEFTMTDPEFYTALLGDQYQVMLDDGVSNASLQRAAQAALADLRGGRDSAEIMWATGGDPKALAEMTELPRALRRSASTAAANTTRSRASTNATRTSRKK